MGKLAIVDNSDNVKLLLERDLEELDCREIHHFKKGNVFLEWLQEEPIENNLDLLVLDWVLPGFNGIEIVRIIRQDVDYEDLPILMVTTKDQPQYLEVAFEVGCTDYLSKPINRIELRARVQSLLRLKHSMDKQREQMEELKATKRNLREANEKLEKMAREDGLTGLKNKREFTRRIRNEWKRCQRNQDHIALIMVDVDFFKSYNDSYGHESGDEVLQKIGTILDGHARRPGDCAARYGGEEFAVILRGAPTSDARDIAKSIKNSVEDLGIKHQSSKVSEVVTVSAGVSSIMPEHGQEHDLLINYADEALYKAKESGRNSVAAVKPSSQEPSGANT